MRALKYFFVEAAASLWRSRGAAMLAIGTMTAGLFMLGFFLLVNANLVRLVARWTEAAEMSVFLEDDTSSDARAAIEASLSASPLVDRFEFVSKAQALAAFKRDFADLASLTDELDGNPLPASFEVRLRSVAGEDQAIGDLAAKLATTAGVSDVRYDRLWVSRLLTVVSMVRGISLVIITIVGIAAALTVANVVRLTSYTRKDELEIMHLVGSPAAFVRGPFVAEGLLQGGIGALVALVVLRVGFSLATVRYGRLVAETLGLDGLAFFPPMAMVWLVVGGMAVGCLAGFAASRGLK